MKNPLSHIVDFIVGGHSRPTCHLRWKDKPECRGKIEGKSLLHPYEVYHTCSINNTPQAYQRCSNRGVTVDVAELVDALGLGSSGVTREGSSPFIDIIHYKG